MFRSRTYGDLKIEQIPNCILDYYNRMRKLWPSSEISITIGTDSQNYSDTKVVSVVAVVCKGHGGIFFYRIERIDKIKDVKLKLHMETNSSLQIADKLLDIIQNDKKYEQMFLDTTYAIHIDAGNSKNGKTYGLIPELIGWVKGSGYDYEIKPDSYTASSIADKISK